MPLTLARDDIKLIGCVKRLLVAFIIIMGNFETGKSHNCVFSGHFGGELKQFFDL